MQEGLEEKNRVTPEAPKQINGYRHYQELSGRINQKDYKRILLKVEGAATPNAASIAQAEFIAKTAGIVLDNETGGVDKRVVLYGIMRNDPVPSDSERTGIYNDHYTRMSDQQLFAEALRMVGDSDSLQKLISKHPNISF